MQWVIIMPEERSTYQIKEVGRVAQDEGVMYAHVWLSPSTHAVLKALSKSHNIPLQGLVNLLLAIGIKHVRPRQLQAWREERRKVIRERFKRREGKRNRYQIFPPKDFP